jgi:radical SAM protein with 4Fe4S-binding SPASM domain
MGPQAKEAVPALTDALKDGDATVRSGAASALGAVGPEAKPAVPALMELLRDKEQYVRVGAARALGSIGPEAKAAVPALIQAYMDEVSSMFEEMRKQPSGPGAAYVYKRAAPPYVEALGRIGEPGILGDHVYRDQQKNAQSGEVRLTPEEAAKGIVREKGGVDKILDGLRRPSFRDYEYLFSCLGNYRQVIVDPNLNLLPCIIIRHPDYTFSLKGSSLYEGLMFVEGLSKIRHKRADERDRCGRCQIRGICRNCPANAYLENGDYEGIGEYYCQISQRIAGILGLEA